jgi:hypothetical protein
VVVVVDLTFGNHSVPLVVVVVELLVLLEPLALEALVASVQVAEVAAVV